MRLLRPNRSSFQNHNLVTLPQVIEQLVQFWANCPSSTCTVVCEDSVASRCAQFGMLQVCILLHNADPGISGDFPSAHLLRTRPRPFYPLLRIFDVRHIAETTRRWKLHSKGSIPLLPRCARSPIWTKEPFDWNYRLERLPLQPESKPSPLGLCNQFHAFGALANVLLRIFEDKVVLGMED